MSFLNYCDGFRTLNHNLYEISCWLKDKASNLRWKKVLYHKSEIIKHCSEDYYFEGKTFCNHKALPKICYLIAFLYN